ncbi:hypothetical protein U5922_014250 [Aquicoccus sp. G2-2]|uniref:hypothetical protein n=1 Tax=Aquicoccus sp. G2-2 TaxID=3092120 RepID=UPI002AE0AF1F|nr:hypothetical protein [Aquicoccus sp. G2-2]MEA1114560.1 hypothetical protein [Aquicoccus sp. G2-2]
MIDWRKVTELRDEIGEEDFAEVVDLFLAEIDEAIGQLCRGCRMSNWKSAFIS